MFQLIKIQLEIFAPLQTLFSPVNYFLLKISANVAPTLAPEKMLYPANAVSLFENRHFPTHRPQLFISF